VQLSLLQEDLKFPLFFSQKAHAFLDVVYY